LGGCGCGRGADVTGCSGTAAMSIVPLGSSPALAAKAVSPLPSTFMPPGSAGLTL
jgi:hypothetical protein